MPLIDDRIDVNFQVFSVIDLKNGFFHVPIKAESQNIQSSLRQAANMNS